MGNQVGTALAKGHPALAGLPHEGALTPLLFRVVKEGALALSRKELMVASPIIVGETGCYSIYGCHDPMAAQWTEEYQSEYLDHWLNIVKASPEIAGFTVWQFCDARTYFRGGSDIRLKPLAFNLAGLFDRHRNAKLAATTVKIPAFAMVEPFQKKRKSATATVASASTKLGMIFAAVASMTISFSGLK